MSAFPATGKKRKRAENPNKHVQLKKAATQAAVNGAAEQLDSTKPKAKPVLRDAQTTNGFRSQAAESAHAADIHIQLMTGSYERVLHGICATIPKSSLSPPKAQERNGDQDQSASPASFSDTFLFAAHASSIRCLAISPPTSNSKRTLATGSSDERINLYSISTSPPASKSTSTKTPSLAAPSPTSENAHNRSLGNLFHHDRAITALAFPSNSKLFSAAEDNTVAISRTRDWTMLSSIRAPIPKAQGRPSGDTAGPGEIPAGVNDFAVHPSQKLMLSVGRGERCMRLWNLITGKKAGVLNFEREVLAQAGEGRFGSGEGRKVLWDEGGEIYVVGFERGAVVFGIDSKPRALVKSDRPTKFHQMRFLPVNAGAGERVLAASTEDGRVLFYDLSSLPDDADTANLPQCPCIAQLGGRAAGIAGRVKDFEILQLPASSSEGSTMLLVVTASSDGAVRIWSLGSSEVNVDKDGSESLAQVGHLVGTLETSNRITCLAAFVMDGKPVDGTDGAAVLGAAEDAEGDSEDEESDEDSD